MKEPIGTAMNVGAVVSEGGRLRPMVEAVIVVSEPQYAVDAAGGLVRSRTTETLRFSAPPATLRSLARTFAEWADAADKAVSAAVETTAGGDGPEQEGATA